MMLLGILCMYDRDLYRLIVCTFSGANLFLVYCAGIS